MKIKSSILKNVIYAFGAQGISMMLSILMALFLPKVLGVSDYGYWQLFIFYTSYGGFFHLGLNDGIYLKFGGKEYKQLDYSYLNANLLISTLYQFCICVIVFLFIIGNTYLSEYRLFVIICTFIYIILCNYCGLLSCVLQITNRIKEYSISVVIDKIGFTLVVLYGIFTWNDSFEVYIILYIFSKFISTVYCIFHCKEIVCSYIKFSVTEIFGVLDNIKVGIVLTISNIVSMLILGIGRFFIDSNWGIEVFSKLSLALALSNFFLQFISQASLVLFPTLRRLDLGDIAKYYKLLRTLLSVILSGLFLAYLPIYYILSNWIPQYIDSLRYMVLLLPICAFDGKMNLLCSTYLKVLRKERQLLKFNTMSMSLSFILCFLSAYFTKNIIILICCMTFSIAFRSICSEIYLSRYFHENIIMHIFFETIISVIFVFVTWFWGPFNGFIIFLITYITFCFFQRKELYDFYSNIRLF